MINKKTKTQIQKLKKHKKTKTLKQSFLRDATRDLTMAQ